VNSDRTIPRDWYPGRIPENVEIHPSALVETSYSFTRFRSERPTGVRIDSGASVYLGTMFDVGREGEVRLGAYALVTGARIICDALVEIGDYSLISWNVVIMDSYQLPLIARKRREELDRIGRTRPRRLERHVTGRPIHIGSNVWIGFDACILPGVTIGEGSIVGAKSVVADDVEPYVMVAGNPARVVCRLSQGNEQRNAFERERRRTLQAHSALWPRPSTSGASMLSASVPAIRDNS
jgi:acetyltransferase-like isoleucine patch superfamily enzyme